MIGPGLSIDPKDLDQLRRAIERLPGEIKTKAMSRAMTRMRGMMRTYVVKEAALHTKVPKEVVSEITTAGFNAGGHTSSVVVESGWIPLKRLGAVQGPTGVYVNLRGSYKHAFVATMKSGHVGVFRRVPGMQRSVTDKREKIREQWGPNPAHAITNNPERYEEAMAEMIQTLLFPRYAHEVEFILSRVGGR
ncbi:hypothetical protein [Rhizobium tumorigenes]|uniref:hypothetical protein n=1 Tax=Rhizobium tumorigenes TaxID=2041385 RepID=UPI00241D8088|nr:hypothetical protein [Rhizobium tumorigenes]WFS01591.1 hypothetical protein PR016_02855 [Rhizobium tumorigenes]